VLLGLAREERLDRLALVGSIPPLERIEIAALFEGIELLA
jgi:hypothetical protein